MSSLGCLSCLSVLIAVGATGPAPRVHAGWDPGGVTVRATDARIPVVAACTDGGAGTFVGWQEASSFPSGPLRVQHLLSTGNLDPAWPAEGTLTGGVTTRDFVDLVPDRQGGVYAYWVESSGSSSLFLTRLDPGGQVANGWPASGRSLGVVDLEQGRPRAIEDGLHGLFIAWTTGPEVFVQRFGSDGMGTGGWPNAPVIVAPSGPITLFQFWPDLAIGPDGGVFVSWATWSADTGWVASGLYVRRFTGAGANSPGWPKEGQYVGFLRPEFLIESGGSLRVPLLDIAPDARGGLFCIAGSLRYTRADVRLHRLLADGQPSPGWPSGGRALPWYPDSYEYSGSGGPDEGLRVHPDGQDGAMVESQFSYTHARATGVSRCVDGGPWVVQMQGEGTVHEVVVKGDGGAFMAECVPTGPFGPYSPDAFIAVDQSYGPPGWSRWLESHPGAAAPWFGDIALAPAGDGGVAFFWSQHRERFGLFARRFTTAGQVTAVDHGVGPGAPGLDRVRFVHGTGVVVRVTWAGAPTRLELFDVGGRRLALRSYATPGPGAADVTLPGTASLASGLYFVRLASERFAAVARVAVIR